MFYEYIEQSVFSSDIFASDIIKTTGILTSRLRVHNSEMKYLFS